MHSRSRIRLSADARNDVSSIVQYHESQQKGVGHRFLRELVKAIDAILERPASFPMIYRSVRRSQLDNFPYGVFFRVQPDATRIIAVVDLRRHPRHWRRRV